MESIKELHLQAVIGYKGSTINGLQLHPDNKHLIYTIGSNIVIRNVIDKSQVFLRGHDSEVNCIAVSRDGKYIASGQKWHMGFPADVIVWSVEERKIIHRFAYHKVAVNSLSFSHDGAYLATLGCEDDNMLVVWDLAIGRPLCTSPVGPDVAYVAEFFNLSNRHLMTGGNCYLRMWYIDVENKRLKPTSVNTGTLRRVTTTILLSEDDKVAYCGNNSGDILEIDVERALYRRMGPPKKPFPLGISVIVPLPGGDLLIGTGDGTLARLQEGSMRPIRQCQVLGGITSIAMTADSSHFFCGTSQSNVYWVGTDSLTPELRNTCHSDKVNAIIFPAGTSDVFATCASNDIRLWNARARQEVLRIKVPNLDCYCGTFPRDGKSFVTGWSDGRVRSFLPQSGKLSYVINDAHRNGVTAIAVTSGLDRLVTGGMDGDVRIWRLGATQTMEATLKEHRGRVWCINFSSDCTKVASCSADGSCIIWNVETKSRHLCIFESTVFKSVAFHPDDSQMITVGTDRKVAFWDTFDGQPIRALEGSESAEVNATAISRSGSHYVSAGGDALIRLWDYDQGLCKFIGKGHSAAINAAAISPDQKTIVTVGTEGAIFIWEVPEGVQERCRDK